MHQNEDESGDQAMTSTSRKLRAGAAIVEALRAEGVAAAEAGVALAAMKAAHVAGRAPADAIVLGADQLLELDGDWLEKPGSRDAARAQLRRLRGRSHRLLSAAVSFRAGTRIWHAVAAATLTLRPCSDAFLERYLDGVGDAVLGCVGAYQLEGPGAQLMAEVDGAHPTVLGLPLLPVLQHLREQGVLET